MEKTREEIREEAYKILMTWDRTALVNDILELTSDEGLKEFVEGNELI